MVDPFFAQSECQLSSISLELLDPFDLVRFFDINWEHGLESNASLPTRCSRFPHWLSCQLRRRVCIALWQTTSPSQQMCMNPFPFFSGAHRNRCCSAQVNLKYSGRTVSKANETPAILSPGSQIEVTTHTTYVRYPTSQSSYYGSNVGMNEQSGDEGRERRYHDDVESSV
jgi:hypothetical protein